MREISLRRSLSGACCIYSNLMFLNTHLWDFHFLQAVGAVSEAKPTAGEMFEELKVHRYRVPVRGVWRKGNRHTH